MRHVVGGRASQPEKQAASTSEVGRFETKILTSKDNPRKLMDLSAKWIDKVHQRQPLQKIILDLDSSVSDTTESKRAQFTMGTLKATATILCSCSISSAAWNGACCVEARPSSGSRKARTRSPGRSSPAAASRTTRHGCSGSPWLTT